MCAAKSSNQLRLLSVGVAAILWAQAANAVIADDVPNTTLQTITVTANSAGNNGVQNDAVDMADDTPATQASQLSDFLEVVPGVNVGGTSAVSQRIQIRGLDDTNLKVTIDGARQEGYLFHHMGDILLDPDLLKSAEVAVGNNSVTLGNDAIGGGVAFTTLDAVDLLRPNQKMGARINASYASNNDELLRSATVFAMPTDNIDVLAYYGKRSANAGEDGDGRAIQTNESDAESLLLKAGAYVTPTQRIRASFQRTENSGEYPIRPDFPLTGPDGWNPAIPQEMNRDTYTVGYRYQPNNPYIDLDISAYDTETQILRNGGSFDARATTTGGKIQNISRIENGESTHKLITGVEHYQKDADYEGVERGSNESVSGSDSAKSTSVFVEDQWRFNKLTLTPGVRYDHYVAPEDVAGGETYDHVVGALAASYDILPSTSVFASYTQLFNGPDLNEVIRNRGGSNIYLTPDLDPETGDNTEVGFVSLFHGITTADDSLRLSGKYFVTALDDVIESVSGLDCQTGESSGTGACRSTVNKDESFDIKGVELAADYIADRYNVGLSYARARSEGEDTGDSLYRDTGDSITVNIGYQPTSEVNIGWRSKYVHDLKNQVGDSNEYKPGYDVHDIFMSYEPTNIDGIKASIGVYNLFDETYASHASRVITSSPDRTDYAQGRTTKVSLSYLF
ncbi:TonB-dependent receptor domain-containing protein [Psychrobacter piscatorii]|uniref:TonB-dependent receptor domain-containing protein n=1 Tax=Psychrobacter piscatorii TaxID=554343 RepID=UPI0037367D4E